MSEVKWIKVAIGMFDDEKIKIIDSMANRDIVHYIWIRLLIQAGKTNSTGSIFLNENIPYTKEMLSIVFNRPINAIESSLRILTDLKMIDIDEEGIINISNWDKYQNIEGMEKIREQTKKRVEKYRAKKKSAKSESQEEDLGKISKDNNEEIQQESSKENFTHNNEETPKESLRKDSEDYNEEDSEENLYKNFKENTKRVSNDNLNENYKKIYSKVCNVNVTQQKKTENKNETENKTKSKNEIENKSDIKTKSKNEIENKSDSKTKSKNESENKTKIQNENKTKIENKTMAEIKTNCDYKNNHESHNASKNQFETHMNIGTEDNTDNADVCQSFLLGSNHHKEIISETDIVDYLKSLPSKIRGYNLNSIKFAVSTHGGQNVKSAIDKALEVDRPRMNYINGILNNWKIEGYPENIKNSSNTNTHESKYHKHLKFNNFEGRNYDYEKLENALLGWQEE